MSQSPKLPPSIFNSIVWNSENQAIWIASSLILRRNLARYYFPSKLKGNDFEVVLQSIKKAVLEQPSLKNPLFFSDKEIPINDRELLFEHFLLMRGMSKAPDSSGIVIDDSGLFLAFINADNHLEMRALCLNNQLEKTWNFLTEIDTAIGKMFPFAFSSKFGYLTADPGQAGTGLTVHAFLHLPALIHTKQIEKALASTNEEDIFFTGISGDTEEPVGDLVVIQNNYSLGMSEEAILHAVQTAATKLIGAEKTMRAHLKEEKNMEIKDLVGKAYGLLTHSYQLETKEALNLLSLVKLGLALEYISGIHDQKMSELFFKCRRGHLCSLFPELKEAKDIAQKRAEFLQKELQGLKT